jgi:hypothetical protein
MGTNDNGSKNCQLIIIPVKVKRKQVRPTKQQTRFVEGKKKDGDPDAQYIELNRIERMGCYPTVYTNRICEKTKKVDRQTEVNRPVDSESLKHLVRPFFFSLSFDVNRKKNDHSSVKKEESRYEIGSSPTTTTPLLAISYG